jgi:TatD DNase family protein
MEFVDTHCHLDFNTFDTDRGSVLRRAVDHGLRRLLVPGVDLASSQRAIRLAEAEEHVFAAVGVHPNDALSWKKDSLATLRHLAEHPKVVAIGEIGLDYYRDRASMELQARIFNEQLALAAQLGLPVVIHSRQAMEDTLEALETWQQVLVASDSTLSERPGVLHSFSGRLEEAQRAIRANFFIGATGPVTYPNAHELRKTLLSLNLEDILIETDAPFLTPQPHRGERNEPAYVCYVAEKLAEMFDLSLESVASTTTNNANKIFNW